MCVCVCRANEHTLIVASSERLISCEPSNLVNKEGARGRRLRWSRQESLRPVAAAGGLCFISPGDDASPFHVFNYFALMNLLLCIMVYHL